MAKNAPGLYRVRQFVWALSSSIVHQTDAGAAAAAAVAAYLPPDAARLFASMPGYDRRHALHVLHTLQAEGHGEPALLAAALLHDVGKTAYPAGRLRLGHRVAVVLVNAVWPGLLTAIARGYPAPGRWPFYVQVHHASIGADLARQAGCLPRTVELIRNHEEPPGPRRGTPAAARPGDPALAALQAADNQN